MQAKRKLLLTPMYMVLFLTDLHMKEGDKLVAHWEQSYN